MLRPDLDILRLITSRQRLKQFLTTPLYANAIYLMVNTAVTASLGFFFWVVVARFYAEAEVGYSSAIIAVVKLCTVFSVIGFGTSLVRFLPQTEKPEGLINSCLTLSSLISLVAAGIFVAGLDIWSPALAFIKTNAVFALVFIITVMLWTLSNLTDAAFMAKRRAGFILYKQVIFSLVKIALPILLVLFFRSFGIIASWGIAVGVSVAISLLFFLPRVQSSYKPVPTLNLSPIKGKWQYSGNNYVINLLSMAPASIIPPMVVDILGPQNNAYFYIAWTIATMLTAIPHAVSQSLFAEGSHFEAELRENALKSFKFIFMLLIPAVILLFLVGKWLLLAFGQSYSDNALYLLWILSISSFPMAIKRIYTIILRVRHRLKELIAIHGFVAVAVIITSYLIMPVTGIIGIGYVWLGVQSLAAIYIAARLRPLLRS